MGISYKVLGQLNPPGNVQQNVYVVPAATEAVISTIAICNQSASNATYSLSVMPEGQFANAAAAKNYIVLGSLVPPADTIFLTVGITANANTILAANCSTSNVSISIFGSEIT